MYKLYLDQSAYEYLREWSEQYKKYVKDCPPYTRKYKIILQDDFLKNLVMYVSSTRYGYKFNIDTPNGLIAKGQILRTPEGINDFAIKFSLAEYTIWYAKEFGYTVDEFVHKILGKIIEMYSNAFIMANAFLMYGNVVNDKEIVPTGRNEGFDKVIVFRKHKDKVYAVPTHYHRSPEGVFEVRGHFRHYKDGKLVWIDSYLKGTDKDEEN